MLASLRHRPTSGERLVKAVTKNVDELGGSLRNAIDPVNRTSSGIAQTVGATLIAMLARSLLQAAGNRIVTKSQPRSDGRRTP